MFTPVETTVVPGDGLIVVRDVGDVGLADFRAAGATMRGVSQRGRGAMVGAAGGILLIKCADQYSRPTVRIQSHDAEQRLTHSVWKTEAGATSTASSITCWSFGRSDVTASGPPFSFGEIRSC